METFIKKYLSGSSLKALFMAALMLCIYQNINAGSDFIPDSQASEDMEYFTSISDDHNAFLTLDNLEANNEKSFETCDPTITFKNKGCKTVKIYRYHSGHLTHCKTLLPGKVHHQSAHKHDVWAYYSTSGNYLGHYVTKCYDKHININSGGSVDVSAGHDRSICKGESVKLCATGANHYTWSNGQTGACITVSPHSDKTYSVTGTSNGCKDTDYVSVHVNRAKWDHVNKGRDADCDSCNGSIIVDANYNTTGKFKVKYTYNGQTYWKGPFTTPNDIVLNHLCPGVYANITIVGVHTECEQVWPHDIVIEELGCCPSDISAGTIALLDAIGDGVLNRCLGSSLGLQLFNASGTNLRWIITDENLNIVSFPNAPPLSFDNLGVGNYLIWHLSYESIEGLAIGANLDDLKGCFDLSNSIAVQTEECCDADGGLIFFPDAIGNNLADTLSRCLDVPLDSLRFSGVVGANSIWVVTDENANIISLQNSGPFDFSSFGPGAYTIQRLAYDAIQGLAIGANLDDLEGCFDLSNSLTFDVTCCSPTGGPIGCVCEEESGIIYARTGALTGTNMIDICINDGFPNPLDIAAVGTSGTNFAWLITDEDSNILALPDAPPFDLDNGSGEGVYLIRYLAYKYTQNLVVGANLADLRGCYDLSSPVIVTATCCDEDGLPVECQTECEESTLNFNAPYINWQTNSTSGSYTVGNQTYSIDIEDNDNILMDTKEVNQGIFVGIDPSDRSDEVVITYEFSEITDKLSFDIVDLDFKNPKQQEKVCIYGFLGNRPIMPTITSLDGSVAISGNCATATANSSQGADESILVEFTECIDQVVIVYGSGPNAPQNPDYSAITIGKDYGFTTEVCSNPCVRIEPREDESFVADVSIFPNPAQSESFVTLSIESEIHSTANVVVIDALGRTVSNLPIELNGVLNQYRLNTTGFNSGIYFVTLITQEGRSKTQRLVVVRP